MLNPTPVTDIVILNALAETLPDTPETVIALHTLRRGLCRAYVVGDPRQPTALIVDSDSVPGEPSCFGSDPNAIWSILSTLPNWFAANMSEDVAEQVGMLVERDWREPVVFYGDPHFTLPRPVERRSDPNARLLTTADLPLLAAAPVTVRGAGFGSTSALLADGIVAAAIVDNAIVAIAHTSAISDRYADIGVATLPDYRGRGFATVAASLVASAIQATGRTPVWSCGETNGPSLAVARKLGFEPILRRVYVIVESRRK